MKGRIITGILLLLLVAPLILALTCGGYAYLDMKMKDPPQVKDAPWVVQTFSQDGMMVPSRFYYVSEVEIIDGKPVISEYWTFDGKRYKKHSDELVLPTNSRIIRRK